MTKPELGTVSAQLNVRFKTNENCPQVLWILGSVIMGTDVPADHMKSQLV